MARAKEVEIRSVEFQIWPGLTPFGPLLWRAEADTELTLSASPTTAVGQKALALAKRRYSTVPNLPPPKKLD